MQASDITLESIDKVCQFLMEKNPQEVCDKIYENYATLLQDAVVESKEQVFVNQNPRRTLLSKETRDVLESVFAKKSMHGRLIFSFFLFLFFFLN
ncbi:LAMI_0E16358g1_1 [Lachancea mirantina]|uniref:LAMI_0E16358g1_1 n=1 Tax=Lachancea mirantina TaxID=1230905 RepID=A0A1G4JT14_9SACH|nr:LAMI_0E16358g1_1 [Lachancea mirantina]